MKPKICVSISSPNETEIVSQIQRAERLTADLVEVRLDKLRSYDGLRKIAKSAKRPLIATNRPRRKKGDFSGPEERRVKILTQAAEEGFEYVDVELGTSNLAKTVSLLKEKGAKVIVSHHDYFRTPDKAKLASLMVRSLKLEPDVCKIATTALATSDNLTVLAFLQSNHRKTPLVTFAMGNPGVWSRILCPIYGGAFTYASLQKGRETAPGQLTVSDLRSIYGMLGIE